MSERRDVRTQFDIYLIITEHTMFMKIYSNVNMLFYRRWSTYCNNIQLNNRLPGKIVTNIQPGLACRIHGADYANYTW